MEKKFNIFRISTSENFGGNFSFSIFRAQVNKYGFWWEKILERVTKVNKTKTP